MMPVTKMASAFQYCSFIVGYAALNHVIFTGNSPLECAGISYAFIVAFDQGNGL
jgi:hypothetical protein